MEHEFTPVWIISAGILGIIVMLIRLHKEATKLRPPKCYGNHEDGDIHTVRGCQYCLDHLKCYQISVSSTKRVTHLHRVK